MRVPGTDEVVTYLTAERAFYDNRVTSLGALTRDIYDELVARTPSIDVGAPWDDRGCRYWRETPEGADLPRVMRSRESGAAEVLIDLAAVAAAAESTYADLGALEVSPDGRLLAWSADTSGAEVFDLRIRDLESGADLPARVDATHYGAAWSADSGHVFYVLPDHAWRPHEIHRLDVATGETALVLTEADERYFLDVETSRSGEWIVITSASRLSTEVWVIPADRPTESPRSLAGRREGLEYRVEHDPAAARWLVTTNRDSVEFDVMSAPLGSTSSADWEPWRRAAVGERLHGALAFAPAGHLACAVVEGRRDGLPLIQILEIDGRVRHEIVPESTVGAVRLGRNVDVAHDYVTVVTEAVTQPEQWWDVSLATGARVPRHAREVPGLDPSDYVGELVHVASHDGWPVPVAVVRHRRTPLDGSAPCLLYAYGSYESVDDPEFTLSVLPLLDRGVVFAKAHVRGGGEVGRQQWLDGRMTSKWNTFRDFAAVADSLGHDVEGRGPLVDPSRIVGRGIGRWPPAGGVLRDLAAALGRSRGRSAVRRRGQLHVRHQHPAHRQ